MTLFKDISKVRTISTIVFCGVFFGLIRSYFVGHLHGDQYPYSTFLFEPGDRFKDLFNMITITSKNNPYLTTDPFPSNYFPIGNSFFYLFSLLGNKMLIAGCFLGLFLILYFWLLARYLQNFFSRYFLEVLIIFFFSYPMFFNVDRLNIELYNFLLCFLWMYFRDKGKPLPAGLFLALSISMKLYTGVFIILYLKEKKYKEAFFILLFCGVLSVLSMLSFDGGFLVNLQAMLAGFKSFNYRYVESGYGFHHNHSMFIAFKLLYVLAIKFSTGGYLNLKPEAINSLLPFYSILTFVLFGLIVFYVLRKNLPAWMNIFLLTSAILLFPHVSFDYKLIFVYLPLLYFLKEKRIFTNDLLYAAGFGLLLIPHNYIYFFHDVSISTFIYPAVIMLMVTFILIKTRNVQH
ncbi:MAG: glycosyltransferase family 87 protein [Chitinophagaceae bacterium]